MLDARVLAAPGANSTTYRYSSVSTVAPQPELFKVLVVPDFWFDMRDVVLSGGSRNPGEEFLPFYYGSAKTTFFKPTAELLVDATPVGVVITLDKNVQRVQNS